jgi:hypothetical protein
MSNKPNPPDAVAKSEVSTSRGMKGDEQLPSEELQFDYEHRDWVLQTIVGVCNLSGQELSITLIAEGAYISGDICSPQTYFDGLISQVRSATYSGTANEQSKSIILDALVELKQRVLPEKPGEIETRTLRPRYVHLRNARFFAPNDLGRGVPFVPDTLCRIKIASITGFFLGWPFPR